MKYCVSGGLKASEWKDFIITTLGIHNCNSMAVDDYFYYYSPEHNAINYTNSSDDLEILLPKYFIGLLAMYRCKYPIYCKGGPALVDQINTLRKQGKLSLREGDKIRATGMNVDLYYCV